LIVPPSNDTFEVAVKQQKEALLPDSYLSAFRVLKLQSTSAFVSGEPLVALKHNVDIV